MSYLLDLGADKASIRRAVVRNPRFVTNYKPSLIKRKVGYLTKVLNVDIDRILAWPEVLSYSFTRILGPRVAFVKARMPLELQDHASLAYWVDCSDAVFIKERLELTPYANGFVDYLFFRQRWQEQYGIASEVDPLDIPDEIAEVLAAAAAGPEADLDLTELPTVPGLTGDGAGGGAVSLEDLGVDPSANLLSVLKAEGVFNRAALVMLTADGTAEDERREREAGASRDARRADSPRPPGAPDREAGERAAKGKGASVPPGQGPGAAGNRQQQQQQRRPVVVPRGVMW